jgi:hypothetical protein
MWDHFVIQMGHGNSMVTRGLAGGDKGLGVHTAPRPHVHGRLRVRGQRPGEEATQVDQDA